MPSSPAYARRTWELIVLSVAALAWRTRATNAEIALKLPRERILCACSIELQMNPEENERRGSVEVRQMQLKRSLKTPVSNQRFCRMKIDVVEDQPAEFWTRFT
jgi:hypothetical protein